MRLDFWNKRGCDCAAADPIPTTTKEEGRVCRMSPARLLANSLTDPETRGEWARGRSGGTVASMLGGSYVNKARNVTISRYYGLYAGLFISTPFTLSKAEERIVDAALDAFDRHERDKAEARALARLTAPREGLKPDRGETPKSGSTAKRRKPGPKGAPRA